MTTWEKDRPRTPLLARLVLLLIASGIALIIGLVAEQQPELALLAAILPVIGLIIMARPNLATLLVLFLIYSNIVVVAIRFHGVPYLAGAAIPLLLLAPLTAYLLFRRQPLVLARPLTWLILFLGVQFLGVIFARDSQVAMAAVGNYLAEGVLLFLLITNVVRTPAVLRSAIWVLLAAGVLLCIFPIHQQLTGNFDTVYGGFAQLSEVGFRTGQQTLFGEERQYRLAGAIGEQNRFAQVLLMLLPLGLFLYWSEQRPWLRRLALGMTAVILFGFILTFSRGGAVGFALLLLVMFLMRIITLRHLAMVLLVVALVAAAIPQYGLRLATLPGVVDVFGEESQSEEVDGSFAGRATEMTAAALVFADHPIAGVGPNMFKLYSREYGNDLGMHYLEADRDAHSLYLDLAANHGLLGLFAFFGAFAVLFRDLWAARQRWQEERPQLAALATGLMLALVSYLTSGLFLHMAYIRYLWLVVALAAAAAHMAARLHPAKEEVPQAAVARRATA